MTSKRKTTKPKPPRGPRNLKAGGFTNALWRLDERKAVARANIERREREQKRDAIPAWDWAYAQKLNANNSADLLPPVDFKARVS